MTAMREAPTGEAGPAIEAGLIEAGLPAQIARQQGMIWGQAYAQNALDLDPAPSLHAYPGAFSALFGGSDLQVLANVMPERVISARAPGRRGSTRSLGTITFSSSKPAACPPATRRRLTPFHPQHRP